MTQDALISVSACSCQFDARCVPRYLPPATKSRRGRSAGERESQLFPQSRATENWQPWRSGRMNMLVGKKSGCRLSFRSFPLFRQVSFSHRSLHAAFSGATLYSTDVIAAPNCAKGLTPLRPATVACAKGRILVAFENRN